MATPSSTGIVLSTSVHRSEEFSGTVASITSANHLPGRNIQRRKQTRRSVAEVIVSVAFRTATGHQQWWLGTIQSLHLTFFVDTTNNRTIRRMQVQPDDITHLVDELRIFRLFERFSSVWLKAKCVPDAMNRVLSHAGCHRHAAGAPVRSFFGFVSRVGTRTSSTCSSVILRGAPGRGSSIRPSRRVSIKHRRHFPTVGLVVYSFFATARFVMPSTHDDTIRHRNTRDWRTTRANVQSEVSTPFGQERPETIGPTSRMGHMSLNGTLLYFLLTLMARQPCSSLSSGPKPTLRPATSAPVAVPKPRRRYAPA